jgi:predicted dehydrogenase
MKNHQRVRYAVVGLGHISQTEILPAFANTENSELAALVTGDPGKSATLSERYGVPAYGYADFERGLEEARVDAVFIALPNSQHREYTERASRAGVHVLCEKPMATTEEDCQAMIAACERADVSLMTAYRLHFTDAHVCAIELARSGALGELRYFNSLFAMQVKDDNIRVQQEAGGGPLYDIGIYCINAARYLFQDEPYEVYGVTASGEDDRFTEVEEMATVTLRFPGSRLATFTCSFGSANMDQLDLVGSECALHIEPAYGYAGALKWRLKRGDKVEERTFPAGDQFAGEIIYFSNCIRHHDKPEPSGVEGLADVRIINSVYESVRLGRPIAVNGLHKAHRPGASQEIKRPPHATPEAVGAEEPHH